MATNPEPRKARLPIVLMALGVIAVLAVVAVVVTRGSGGRSGTRVGLKETRPVEVNGQALVTLPDGADPAVGSPMPELRGAAFDGSPVVIVHDGKPKVVLFLAHWCPHCQRELPVVTAWLRRGGLADGIELYAVATGTKPDRPNYPPSAWLERERWARPVLADDETFSAAAAVGLSGYPFFVLVDGQGKIVARKSGALPLAELEQLVTRLRAS